MRSKETLARLSRLEQTINPETVLIVVPNDDGTYTGWDQHHKGEKFTKAKMNTHNGPVIIWDVGRRE